MEDNNINPDEFDNEMASGPNNNLEGLQTNINNSWMVLPRTKDFKYICYPMVYYPYYEDIKHLENSNKMVLPKKILNDLSVYNDIEYPMHFTINDSNILFTPSDFKTEIDDIYIPQHFIENLGINIGDEIKLTLLNYKIEKGTKIKLKSHTSNFLEIMDHKQYLEKNLVELYTTLSKGQTILIPYFDNIILIDVLECEPNETISIIDTDLEVDFEAPWDYVEKPKTPEPEPVEVKEPHINFNNYSERNNSNGEFVPFSGVGRKLGDK